MEFHNFFNFNKLKKILERLGIFPLNQHPINKILQIFFKKIPSQPTSPNQLPRTSTEYIHILDLYSNAEIQSESEKDELLRAM